MKKSMVLFLFLSVILSSASARLLSSKQDGEEEKSYVIPETSNYNSLTEIKEDISNLMGLEKCGDGNEECEKRRMIAEAHLDYIYTQNHNHP
ncbi:putative phytosulfokines 6 [Mercurialis annua]|uniref:putative phytosulfokines 6 n=1 Tax=Mercurialis annua TaxID=3986 RepID=UPI002160C4F1|nr:putative phytosulfokines 6 [Mercurialis annua]